MVTSTGSDTKGIIAVLTAAVAEAGGSIADLSQTIVSDFFTLIMLVDVSDLEIPFAEFKSLMKSTAERLGVHLAVMHEDVMQSLQRV